MPRKKSVQPPSGEYDTKSSKGSCSRLPDWPNFRPPLPVVDVTPEIHPECPTVAMIHTFFPRSLCQDYVSFLRTLPFQTAGGRPKRGEARRFNDRFQVDDPVFARRLWEQTGLKEALTCNEHVQDLWGGKPIGLNPNIRVYRYTPGQFFDCHYDDFNDVILPGEPPVEARTTWTLLLYLTSSTEGLVGGETVFYPGDQPVAGEGIRVAPETGMLLLHKHGNRCLFILAGTFIRANEPQKHEGVEVKDGEKWILRTDLCIDRCEWSPSF